MATQMCAFNQAETHKRFFALLEANSIRVNRFRADCGSCSKEIKTIISKLDTKAFGLKETSRIKAFVFSFISVPAKWIMTARRYVLNIYTENRAYARPFITEFG